jgi:hypothetical protein
LKISLLTQQAQFKAQAGKLRPEKQRDELLRKVRELDAAAHLNEWLNSPGLRSPNKTGRKEAHMITDTFDRRTIANMEVALERACLLLPTGSENGARRTIASKIIECANRGDATLSRLTEAGYAAAMQLITSEQLGNPVKEVVDH